ncbi:hypothetical protein [Streptomyces sp. CB03238]|uniref:hypothetical protein n=1 Tax=Streptomyces sp. CB03238 TaxID=1907777 RepID=UPI000A1012D8|nr:hypothetical protein [Streptomyces sp. CB03238]ORT61231.1 hypothetical protein BKD26_03945 [Streptomyces sp. CB03238]
MSDGGTPTGPAARPAWDSRAEAVLSEPALGTVDAGPAGHHGTAAARTGQPAAVAERAGAPLPGAAAAPAAGTPHAGGRGTAVGPGGVVGRDTAAGLDAAAGPVAVGPGAVVGSGGVVEPVGRGGAGTGGCGTAGGRGAAVGRRAVGSAVRAGEGRSAGGVRRGPADPVKALLHRHRELCERAVDPLEIAAGLEAHGVTDRTAARFRHRDVFSLAEELYARVPRRDDSARPRPASVPDTGAALTGWLVLLPGALGALTVAGLTATGGPLRAAVGVAGAAGLAVALTACLRRGPLRAAGRTAPGTRAWTGFLLAYALFGDGLLDQLLTGGPDRAWPAATAPLLGLAVAVAPAAWCAHLFAVRARRRLAGSRGLKDFAAGTRPLLLAVVALYTAALTGLLALVGTVLDKGSFSGGALALGTLLFLARLLTVHGFAGAAATGLLAACATEALALASVLAARLPGCDRLARPVQAAVDSWGAAAVPALACGAAALALLAHATAVLARASAHADATVT